jgi:hypothetical protein
MKKFFLFFFFLINPLDLIAKTSRNENSNSNVDNFPQETKPFFKDKNLEKPKYITIDNDFDITYTLLTLNDTCKIPLEIKNISKQEKKNSLSIDVYSYGNKKYEAFVLEKMSKPGEIVITQVVLLGIGCDDIRKIDFYK